MDFSHIVYCRFTYYFNLIAKLKIKSLTVDRTNKLLATLGIMETVNQPLAVADIYNFKNDNHYKPAIKKTVGFGG